MHYMLHPIKMQHYTLKALLVAGFIKVVFVAFDFIVTDF